MSRYNYSCSLCGQGVQKSATGTSTTKKIKAGLHGWKCGSCGKQGVAVIRTINKEQQ